MSDLRTVSASATIDISRSVQRGQRRTCAVPTVHSIRARFALPAKPAARKREFHQPFQRDLGRPDCAAKIFRFSFPPNQLHLRAIPPHRRGAYASSRYVECGERWTRWRCAREALQGGLEAWSWGCERLIRAGRAALLRTAKACGSGTRGWCQLAEVFAKPNRVRKTVNSPVTEARGIRLRGERAISRQTIAQGRPDALRWTCMLVCALLCAIAHETAGAARTRSSLRPLSRRGPSGQLQLGRVAPRERAGISASHGLIRFPLIIIPS